MNQSDVFDTWAQSRDDFNVSQSFCDELMTTVRTRHFKPVRFDFIKFMDVIMKYPLVRTGLITTAAVTGLLRIILILHTALSQGTLVS